MCWGAGHAGQGPEAWRVQKALRLSSSRDLSECQLSCSQGLFPVLPRRTCSAPYVCLLPNGLLCFSWDWPGRGCSCFRCTLSVRVVVGWRASRGERSVKNQKSLHRHGGGDGSLLQSYCVWPVKVLDEQAPAGSPLPRAESLEGTISHPPCWPLRPASSWG